MKKIFATVVFVTLGVTPVYAADSIIMEGDYIRTAISDDGTLGFGGTTSPGMLYDSAGTGTFNPAYDYLTPGSPFEGFYFRSNETGTIGNNNAYADDFSMTNFEDRTSIGSAFDHHVRWTGNYDGGDGTMVTMVQDYWFNNSDQAVHIRTQIEAREALAAASFLRTIDPDPDSNGLPGSTTTTVNSRGFDSNSDGDFDDAGDIAPENIISSVGPVSGAPVALYTNSAVTHNTAVSASWDTDPVITLAGSGDLTSDATLGIAFDLGNLTAGQIVELYYNYIFGGSLEEAIEIIESGGRLADALEPEMKGLADEIQDDVGGDFIAELLLLDETSQRANIMQLYTQAPPVHNTILNGRRSAMAGVQKRASNIRASLGLSSTTPLIKTTSDKTEGDAELVGPEGPAGPDVLPSTQAMQMWIQGLNVEIDKDSTDGFSGYDSSFFGFTVGADKTFTSGLYGIAFGYGSGDLDSDNGDQGDSDTWSGAVYGSIVQGDAFVDVSLSYGYSNIDLEYGSDFYKKADFSANDYLLDISLGREFRATDKIAIIPEIISQISYYDQDSYTEESTVGTSRIIGGYEHWDYIFGAGMTVATKVENDNIVTDLEGRVSYRHNLNADEDNMTYRLQGGNGQIHSFETQVLEKNVVDFGLGTAVTFSNKFKLAFDADGFIGNDINGWKIGGSVSYSF